MKLYMECGYLKESDTLSLSFRYLDQTFDLTNIPSHDLWDIQYKWFVENILETFFLFSQYMTEL